MFKNENQARKMAGSSSIDGVRSSSDTRHSDCETPTPPNNDRPSMTLWIYRHISIRNNMAVAATARRLHRQRADGITRLTGAIRSEVAKFQHHDFQFVSSG
jgi:hypothetical protein